MPDPSAPDPSAPDPSAVAFGADGCRGGGWVVAALDAEGEVHWEWCEDTAALLDLCGGGVACLDVPIGLPALGSTRACDVEARRRLGRRSSSVFAAPPREVLACATYQQARPVAPSLSAQAFGLVPRIREVDELVRAAGSEVHRWLVEGHPEVAFAAMSAGRLALASKKTAEGALQRLALVEELLPGGLPTDVPVGAALDDALDAAALALVARRFGDGEAEVLGGQVDELGLPMRIVC